MQFDEASNKRTNQATIDEGGREQQNRHSWLRITESFVVVLVVNLC